MKQLVFLCALVGACSKGSLVGHLLDDEAMNRAMVNDKGAAAQVGGDAHAKASYKPGSEYYLDHLGEPGDRQIHFWSPQRNSTTIVSSKELRKHTQVRILAVYPGSPPPSLRWLKGSKRRPLEDDDWEE